MSVKLRPLYKKETRPRYRHCGLEEAAFAYLLKPATFDALPELGAESNEMYREILAREITDHVRRVMAHLDERSRFIIERRFGFGDEEPWLLSELGAMFGISKERVRQLETQALEALRHRLEPLRAELVS